MHQPEVEEIQLISINVGKPQVIMFRDQEVSTSIFKHPTSQPLFLSWVNLDGDGQADLVNHGGKEKALCVYSFEHYPYWENRLQQKLSYGAFGENLTVSGLTETAVCIGDIFAFGEAVVQVSQPRQPCYKLTVRYHTPDLPLQVQETGYSGFYFRVLQEGVVSIHDQLKRTTPHPHGVTVAEANRVMHHDKDDEAGIQRLLAVDALSSNWRATLAKRLQGHIESTSKRLTGRE